MQGETLCQLKIKTLVSKTLEILATMETQVLAEIRGASLSQVIFFIFTDLIGWLQ